MASSVITAWAGTRFGPVPTAIAAAAVVAGALVVLVTGPPVGVVCFMLVLAGLGTHGTQCLIIAAVASHYTGHLRGTALRWASAHGPHRRRRRTPGRCLLLAAGLGVNSNSWPSPVQSTSPRSCWSPSASTSSQNSISPSPLPSGASNVCAWNVR
ncbi:hypothetical protein ACW0JT_18570 [Arthrobacter sp. SA17]